MGETTKPNGLTRLKEVVVKFDHLPPDKKIPIVLGMLARHQDSPALTTTSAWILWMGTTIAWCRQLLGRNRGFTQDAE